MDEVKTLIAKINKKYGEATIGFASDKKYADAPRISSGSLFLDWALGKNQKDNQAGFPVGRVIELYGPESSGKSTISMKTVAEAQKKGWLCAYIDCENSFDKSFAEALGVDTKKLILTAENGLDNVFNIIVDLLEQTPIKIIVIDSIAALIPTEEIVKEQGEKKTMASTAKGMAEGMRRLNHANKNKALCIFVNQLRQNPGATYGNPEYTPGGNSVKYYASIRAEIRKGDWILEEKTTKEGEDKETKKKIGQVIRFKIIKNKVSPPFKEGYFKIFYTGQMDQVDELVSMALLQEKITRKGGYYGFGKHTYQGRESLEKALKNEKDIFEELKELVFSGEER